MGDKFLLCVMCKLENHYLGEWITYHLNIGFDKIVIIDNNDTEGEFAENIYNVHEVTEGIERGVVEVVPLNNGKYLQQIQYMKVYERYKYDYDWFCFLDIDEFLTLTATNSVKEFVQLPQFEDYNAIRLCWKCYSDNNLIGVENNNFSVLERFTEPSKNLDSKMVKTIFKSFKDEEILFPNSHGPVAINIKPCNADGVTVLTPQKSSIKSNDTTYNHAYIRHYPTKTIEEYLNIKLKRGGSAQCDLNLKSKYNLDYFFRYNKLTHEKKKFIFDKLNANSLHECLSHNILFINIDRTMNDAIIKSLNYKNVNNAHNIKYDITSDRFMPYNINDSFLSLKNYEVIICSIDCNKPKYQEYMAKIDERFKNNISIIYISASNYEVINKR